MRSRYSAYAVKNVEYLVATHAPEQREPDEEKNTRAWANRLKWLKLEVLDTQDGAAQDTGGEVEFRATFVESKRAHVIGERSRFRKDDGRWLYVDGDLAPPRTLSLGRNDLCPCDSGLKFKKCHGG
jgi:SEC-C motif-containing protein